MSLNFHHFVCQSIASYHMLTPPFPPIRILDIIIIRINNDVQTFDLIIKPRAEQRESRGIGKRGSKKKECRSLDFSVFLASVQHLGSSPH